MQIQTRITSNQLKKKLRKFVNKNYPIKGTFDDNDSFFEQGIIDSTGVLELIAFLENKFNIEIKDEELIPENLDSINNLSKFIQGKYNHAGE